MTKPVRRDLMIVTATTDVCRALPCLRSWQHTALMGIPLVVVINNRELSDERDLTLLHEQLDHVIVVESEDYLGVVPAFALGVEEALQQNAQIIACFHDDLDVEQDGWDAQVLALFDEHSACGLAGFGGGKGLGSSDIYRGPYDPMQLARQDFISNMRDAQLHGRRVTWVEPVACLDGFSQIGRRQFWEGCMHVPGLGTEHRVWGDSNLFGQLAELGIIHHAYDAALGCYAKRLGWEVLFCPIHCNHAGGQTAVRDAGYHQWADEQTNQPGEGDQAFWHASHKAVYEEFRDILPIRTI